MADRNPFTALGLAPSLFEGLSDGEVRELLKSHHRALSVIHHPDRGGDENRFKEVQAAFDKLKEDFEFDYWKTNFLRPRKDKLDEAQKELEASRHLQMVFRDRLLDFWMAYIRGGYVMLSGPGSETSRKLLGERIFEELCQERVDRFSVFSPPPLSILANNQFEREMGMERHDRTFEVQIKGSGDVFLQNLVQTFFDPTEKWTMPVRREWVFVNNRKPFYWCPQGEPVPVRGKLIGSVGKDVFRRNRRRVKGYISHERVTPAERISDFGYSWSEFEQHLLYLNPMVSESEYMVTVEESEEAPKDAHFENSLRFKILGCPTRILNLE